MLSGLKSVSFSAVSFEEEESDEEAEKAFLQFYINVPKGPPLSQVLRDPEKRRRLGKLMSAHNMLI